MAILTIRAIVSTNNDPPFYYTVGTGLHCLALPRITPKGLHVCSDLYTLGSMDMN